MHDAPNYVALDGFGNLFEVEEQLGKFKLKKLVKKLKKISKPSILSLGKKGKKGKKAKKRFLISGGLFGIPEPRPAFVLGGYVYGSVGPLSEDSGELSSMGKLKLFKKLGKAVKKVTKGVKKVVKSPAFKKLAIIGGIVAGSMFLGPAAGALIKKGAGMLAKKVAEKKLSRQSAQSVTAYEGEVVPEGEPSPGIASQVIGNITGVLGSVAAYRAIQSGAVPAPPNSIGSSNFTEWATSAGVNAMETEAGRQLSPYERTLAEQRIRPEVEALQEETTGRPPAMSTQNMLMIGGAALLGVVLLTQGKRS